MNGIDRLVQFFLSTLTLTFIFAFPFFVGLCIFSLTIVPMTYIYSLLTGRSYNSTIDSSGFLYKMNIIGQWSYFILACYLLFFIVIKSIF